MSSYPKVTIEYCAKCKWQNRAIWYVQEILQTFSKPDVNLVQEVAVQPRYDFSGLFKVTVHKDSATSQIVYQRKFNTSTDENQDDYIYEGFPDSKFLKTLVRDYLFPENHLGHIDGHGAKKDSLGGLTTNRAVISTAASDAQRANAGASATGECVQCEK